MHPDRVRWGPQAPVTRRRFEARLVRSSLTRAQLVATERPWPHGRRSVSSAQQEGRIKQQKGSFFRVSPSFGTPHDYRRHISLRRFRCRNAGGMLIESSEAYLSQSTSKSDSVARSLY